MTVRGIGDVAARGLHQRALDAIELEARQQVLEDEAVDTRALHGIGIAPGA